MLSPVWHMVGKDVSQFGPRSLYHLGLDRNARGEDGRDGGHLIKTPDSGWKYNICIYNKQAHNAKVTRGPAITKSRDNDYISKRIWKIYLGSSHIGRIPAFHMCGSSFWCCRWRRDGNLLIFRMHMAQGTVWTSEATGRTNTRRAPWDILMNMSGHGTAFHISGPLWGESTGDRWIPPTNGQ